MLYTFTDLLTALAVVVATVAAIAWQHELEHRRRRRDRATDRALGVGPYAPTAKLPAVDLNEALLEHAALIYPDVGRSLALTLLQLSRRLGIPVRLPRVGIDHLMPGYLMLEDPNGHREYVPLKELA